MALPCGVGDPGGLASHEVFWCIKELEDAVILDIGCLKSVAGTTWVSLLLRKWQQEGRWIRVEKEKEVFRFGNGETLTSQYGVQLEATFAGRQRGAPNFTIRTCLRTVGGEFRLCSTE